ncbi:MAG: hypothetical protein ACYC7A_17695 [Thermoanaerobaculia bacterium]
MNQKYDVTPGSTNAANTSSTGFQMRIAASATACSWNSTIHPPNTPDQGTPRVQRH